MCCLLFLNEIIFGLLFPCEKIKQWRCEGFVVTRQGVNGKTTEDEEIVQMWTNWPRITQKDHM